MKSLPGGPLKSFDCLTATVQAKGDPAEEHGASAVNDTVIDPGYGTDMLRSWSSVSPFEAGRVDPGPLNEGGAGFVPPGMQAELVVDVSQRSRVPAGKVILADPIV
ncbi:MAG: hypothetical protein ACJ77A_13110 [Actinomycetota bacterium]